MTERTPISPDLLPPDARWLADRYEFVSELGRGGMSVVYLARERESGRPVAIKLVSGRYAGDEQCVRRFAREARTVAGLHHPNIVQFHEVGRQGDRPYFTLEYVAGGSLDRRIAGTPQPAARAAELAETLARAVHFAHDKGVIHRDLKPGNVLLTAWGPVIVLLAR